MPYISSPKIRGWKRRIRQLDRWLEKFKKPNIHELDEGFAEYVKIWIHPWFQLAKRNPPLWYFRLILDRFSIMHDHWQVAFRQSPHPNDLQLWIFEDNIIESELVCARVRKLGELRDNYFEPCPEARNFPSQKFDSTIFQSQSWTWSLFYASNHYFEKMDTLSTAEIQNLLDNGFQEEIVFEGETNQDRHFWKPYDYVWVGRKKG